MSLEEAEGSIRGAWSLLWEILTPDDRRSLRLITFALFARGLLETFAVVSVMPFIALVAALVLGNAWFPAWLTGLAETLADMLLQAVDCWL